MNSDISITKRFEFSSSHRLWQSKWSHGKNIKIFGKSANSYGHGHNYVLFVTISGKINKKSGMIINLTELKQIINDVILQFDHKFLNRDTPFFKEVLPTLENIANEMFGLIKEKIKPEKTFKLKKIRLYQSTSIYVDIWQ